MRKKVLFLLFLSSLMSFTFTANQRLNDLKIFAEKLTRSPFAHLLQDKALEPDMPVSRPEAGQMPMKRLQLYSTDPETGLVYEPVEKRVVDPDLQFMYEAQRQQITDLQTGHQYSLQQLKKLLGAEPSRS